MLLFMLTLTVLSVSQSPFFYVRLVASAGNNGRSTFNDRQNPLSDRLKLPPTDQNDR